MQESRTRGDAKRRGKGTLDRWGLESLAGAARAPMPAAVEPQLATLVASAPEDGDWLHEIKWDGYRLLAFVREGHVSLLTRGGLDWTSRYPAVAAALAAGPWREAIFDGEVVALDAHGVSDFQALQNLGRQPGARPTYMVFDLLHLDGWDLRQAPLQRRKDVLADVLAAAGLDARDVKLSGHVIGQGQDYLAHACRLGLEGIVSKRRDGTYRAGRSGTWLKAKCSARQELVIGGYSDPGGGRKHLGALLLGVYEDGRLRYAGRTGTGFSAASLKELARKLGPLEQKTSPFSPAPRGAEARGAHWVKPELVAEVSFAGFTADGRVRQAAFRGLREDKPARAIVRERAAAPADTARSVAAEASTVSASAAPPRPAAKATRAARAKKRSTGRDDVSQPAASSAVDEVPLSHPDRILFPEQGLTKRDLAHYYATVAPLMLPLASGRPLTLVRCPRGREGACFFQKHADSGPHPEKGTPLGLGRVPIVERGAKSPVDYWSLEDARGLTSLVQRGVLEIHLAGARAAAVESPDRLVIDLDPDEAISWESLARAAEEVRERWRQFGLESFLLSTGGKGLHIVAPVSPPRQGSWGWDEARALSEVIAVGMAADSPQRFVAQAAKDARRGRIFVDYLRNGRGATAIAPYSTRARPGAPVAVPLSWDAVKAGTERPFMTVKDWLAKPRQDPWRAYEAVARQVPRLPRERRASTGRSVRAAPAREAGR